MTHRIDELIWRALTDVHFRDGLLGSRRRELSAALGLSEAEREIVMSVQADTLVELAAGLCVQPSVLAPRIVRLAGRSHLTARARVCPA